MFGFQSVIDLGGGSLVLWDIYIAVNRREGIVAMGSNIVLRVRFRSFLHAVLGVWFHDYLLLVQNRKCWEFSQEFLRSLNNVPVTRRFFGRFFGKRKKKSGRWGNFKAQLVLAAK